jgi:hypothetical protein
MEQETRIKELNDTWSALDGIESLDGWRTFPLDNFEQVGIYIGRKFPENYEAIIIGFHSSVVIKISSFPQGNGFKISIFEEMPDKQDKTWVSMCRQQGSSLEFFTAMAADIISNLEGYSLLYPKGEGIFSRFISRVVAWQEFMKTKRVMKLSTEEEIGLFGELTLLRKLLDSCISKEKVIQGWKGPLNSVKDFYYESVAIEVKSTISHRSFIATIDSLEQLADVEGVATYLIGFKFSIDSEGETLNDLIWSIRKKVQGNVLQDIFDDLILKSGYLEQYSDQYDRPFVEGGPSLIFEISNNFPRLTRQNVDPAITSVRYSLNLHGLQVVSITLNELIQLVRV